MGYSPRVPHLLLKRLNGMSFNFTKELSQLEPTPKPILSWPWGSDAWEHGTELARVTQSVGVSLRWASVERIKEALAFKPEIIALHWSPFHDKFQGRKWNKQDCGKATRRDRDYYLFFWQKARAAAAVIGDKAKVVVVLDHEMCNSSRKLNAFYQLAKYAFGNNAKVFFYNYNQYASGRGLALMQRASPVDATVQSDYCSFSLYYSPKSVECLRRLQFTTEQNPGKPAVAWVSIGEHYADYSYHKPHGKKQRSENVLYPTQYGETWWLGFWLSDPFLGRNPEKFGNTNQVKLICAWPELLDPALSNNQEHLIMFLKGCNRVYVE